MFSYRTRSQPFIWGHRGVPSEAVENTLVSFARVKGHGLDGFEFDVQFSRDGVPFVFHDDTLTRLAGIERLAVDLSWSELAQLVLRDPARPKLPPAHLSSLQQVLENVPEGLMINLELKANPVVTRAQLALVWDLVEQNHLGPRTLVSSFYHQFLVQLAQIARSVNLAALWVQGPSESAVRQLASLTRVMHIPWQPSRAESVRYLHGLGCEVGVWGVAGVEDLRQCYAAAVDAIFIDDPTWLAALQAETGAHTQRNEAQQ